MNDTDILASAANPYDPDSPAGPFAGREAVLARLHQRLVDPVDGRAGAFTGRRRSGKSALLHQAIARFDDTLVGVYLPLHRLDLHTEAGWLLALSSAIIERVAHLPTSTPLPDTAADRAAFVEDFLPGIFRVIRARRRLALLLDDADRLLDAVAAGQLPNDTFAFLQTLIGPQVGIGVMIAASHEDRLDALAPLVDTADVQRLTNLPLEAVAEALVQPARGYYAVDDETVGAVYAATGGEPWLVHHFGHLFFKEMQSRHNGLGAARRLTPAAVRAAIPTVYAAVESSFRQAWSLLTRDERLVLTAMSSLMYNNPLGVIDVDKIEAWLVETDYPMDPTAIKAAMRGLEYAEIVDGSAANLRIASGLMQKWLLENSQLGPLNAPPSPRATQTVGALLNPRGRALRLLVVILLLLLAAAALIRLDTDNDPDRAPVPTITLLPQGE